MIKNTRFSKKTLDYKYVTDLSDCKKIGVVKTRCNANNDIAQLIVNKRQRKWEIAAMLVFACTSQ